MRFALIASEFVHYLAPLFRFRFPHSVYQFAHVRFALCAFSHDYLPVVRTAQCPL